MVAVQGAIECEDLSLGERVRKGSVWFLAVRYVSVGLNVLTLPVLARLLRPEDYGLMGIVSVAILLTEVFSRTGFEAALIARGGPVEDYLPSMWTAEVLRGVAQFGFLMLVAYPAALFYRQPQIVLLVMAASLVPLLRGFQSTGLVILNKQLAFSRLSLYDAIPALTTVASTLIFAVWWRNVWSLLAGQLVGCAMTVSMSYLLAPIRPRFVYRPDHWRELWRYGRWEMLGAISYVLFHNGDDLFVGRVLGMPALGLYRMAYRLGNMPSLEGVEAMRRVLFPAFARIQCEEARLRRAFIQFWELSSVLGFAFIAVAYFAAESFVHVVFSAKWVPMIPALRVLVVWGGLEVLKTAVLPIFRSVSRPDWWTKLLIFRVLVLAALIYPLSLRWGIAGAACAALASALSSLTVTFFWVSKSVRCSIQDLIRPLCLPAGAAATGLATGCASAHIFTDTASVLHLIAIAAGAGTTFLSVLLMGDALFRIGLRQRLLQAVGR